MYSPRLVFPYIDLCGDGFAVLVVFENSVALVSGRINLDCRLLVESDFYASSTTNDPVDRTILFPEFSIAVVRIFLETGVA